jgi:hypothetical protein
MLKHFVGSDYKNDKKWLTTVNVHCSKKERKKDNHNINKIHNFNPIFSDLYIKDRI